LFFLSFQENIPPEGFVFHALPSPKETREAKPPSFLVSVPRSFEESILWKNRRSTQKELFEFPEKPSAFFLDGNLHLRCQLLQKSPLAFVEIPGNFHIHMNIEISPFSGVPKPGHSFAGKGKHLSGLGSPGNIQGGFSVQGRNADHTSKSSLGKGHGLSIVQGISLPNEILVFFHTNQEEKIPRRASVGSRLPFSGDTKPGSRVRSGRNFNFQAMPLPDTSLSGTGLAGVFDDLSLASAPGAGNHLGKLPKGGTLHVLHLTSTAAGGAGYGRASGLRSGSSAPLTLLPSGNRNFPGSPETDIFEFAGKLHFKVRPATGSVGIARTPPAEEAVENISEDIPEGTSSGTSEAPERISLTFPHEAELIVLGLLLGITQDFVSFAHFLETFLRILIPRISVGMILTNQFAVGPFYFIRSGAPGDS